MKKVLISLIFLLTVLLPQGGFSRGGDGNEQGNGGFVLVCDEENDSMCMSGIFFDVYEAEQRYSLPANFDHQIDLQNCTVQSSPENECFDIAISVALFILQRLEAQDPVFFSILKQHLENFKQEAKFLKDIVILPTEDMGIGFLPPDRELAQLVVQHTPIADEDPRYIISRDLWIFMEPNQQASAILHEIIYRQALVKQTLESSQMVRYFNALLLSGKIETLSKEKYKLIRMKTFCLDKIRC